MQTVDDVLSRLRRVTSLRFEAHSEAATGWNGVGSGTVAVSDTGARVVRFDEAGLRQPRDPARAAVAFNNVFRWTAVSDGLRLEHLRFGPDQPVLLFDMAPGDDGAWREVSPHQCREDCYTASLGVEGSRLVVHGRSLGRASGSPSATPTPSRVAARPA